ncbi:MAG: hypothetical protein IT425_11720, partial [Pirellulales bacterium]|nr:hypothetical protein [Pirellulales bacterium]
MSTDQAAPQSATRPPAGAKVVRYHDYIAEKIEGTRRMVKLVDLATALVELAVAVLLFLAMAVVVEHWVVPGGFSVAIRFVLFAVLAVGCGYFIVRRLWPLVSLAINPVYAAQTIEHGAPTLKNSLINLLLLRQKRSEVSDAVYQTLEEQAARGLTRVSVETAVDRTQLIHLGYVLVAVVAVAASYKVLSPKDPFIAAERLLLPWADIVPASRVTIQEIVPGHVTISRGESIDVSADIRGLAPDELAVLRFSTEDGQIVGRAMPLRRSADGLRYECRLAEEGPTHASVGVTRNLTYRLEAGDARTLTYKVTALPAPSILVERVEFDYPDYTGYLDRTVEQLGDVRGIEGTRVTVHARANGEVREAHVDFDADGRRDLRMSATDSDASATFELALREDRQTPLHASYVLRFTNSEGRQNRNPVKYAIEVDPDMPPEVEIRQPLESVIDVPLDGCALIELGASDPDFALAAVRLRGLVGQRECVNVSLLETEHRGRFHRKFELMPRAHGLKVGNVLTYWVEAQDNRAPQANAVATEHKSLRIIGGKDDTKQEDAKQEDAKQEGSKQEGSKQEGSKQEGAGEQPAEKKSDAGGERHESAGDEKNKEGEKQPAAGEGQQDAGEEQQATSEGQQAGAEGQSAKGKGTADGAKSESTSAEPRPKESESASTPGDQSSSPSAKPSTGETQNNNQPDQPAGGQQSPVSAEGDDDAEAFNRIQEHMQQQGDLPREAQQHKQDQQPSGHDAQDQQPFSRDAERSGAPPTKEQSTNTSAEAKQAPNEKQTNTEGTPGQGDEQQSQGSPDSQPGKKPTEKPQQSPSKGEKGNVEEPPSPSDSRRESDSHG